MAPQLKRVMITKERVAGVISSWSGHFGFITPTKPINHVEAKLHGGKVYLAQDDLLGLKFVKQGAKVDFLVYSDGTGLGVAQVNLATPNTAASVQQKPATSSPAGKGVQKPNQPGNKAGILMPTAKSLPKPGKGNAPNGQVKGVTKTIQKMTPQAAPKAGAVAGKAAGKGKWGAPVKQLGKFAQNTAASAKDAQNVDRKYLSEQKVHGIVEKWMGKFGWIRPLNPVKHAQAKGNLYCSVNDIEGDRLKPGQKVEFVVYANKTGLGAGKVKVKPVPGQPQPAKAPEKVAPKKAPEPASKPQHEVKGKGKGKWVWSPTAAGAQKHGQPQQKSLQTAETKPGQLVQKPVQAASKGKAKGSSKGGAQQHQQQKSTTPVSKTIEKKAVWKPNQQVKGKSKGNQPAKAQAPKGPPPAVAKKSLPANWEEQWSDEHEVAYYWNKVTKESRWVKP